MRCGLVLLFLALALVGSASSSRGKHHGSSHDSSTNDHDPYRRALALCKADAAGAKSGNSTADHTKAGPAENNLQFVGAIMAIIASTCANLGVTIQKTSHNRNSALHPSKQRPYFRRKLWWCGLATVITASICDFEALSFATQVLVATVGGCVTILSNVTFAVVLLKERLTPKDGIGSLLVIAGVVLAALANPPDHLYTVADFQPMFLQPVFLVYCGLLVGALLCMLVTVMRLERGSKHRAFLYAVSSGIFGGCSVLLGKCTSEVVRETIMDPVHNNQVRRCPALLQARAGGRVGAAPCLECEAGPRHVLCITHRLRLLSVLTTFLSDPPRRIPRPRPYGNAVYARRHVLLYRWHGRHTRDPDAPSQPRPHARGYFVRVSILSSKLDRLLIGERDHLL